MSKQHIQVLESEGNSDTRAALHAYARILGDWLKSCRPRRKHWWHASLRPSLAGLTTGVVHTRDGTFELELNIRKSLLEARALDCDELTISLTGQSPFELAALVSDYLISNGIDRSFVPDSGERSKDSFIEYSAEHAYGLSSILSFVSGCMAEFRAGIAEESSPIQLWPHHFDLSMIWLPGEKIPGQDPQDEEHSDKQMNFGFTFGDESIPEPYFYVTAYPLPDAFSQLPLPAGTVWSSVGFSGAVLRYQSLLENDNLREYLLGMWNGLLAAGRKQMLRAAS